MSFDAGQTMHSRLWRSSLLLIDDSAFARGSRSVSCASSCTIELHVSPGRFASLQSIRPFYLGARCGIPLFLSRHVGGFLRREGVKRQSWPDL